MPQYLEPYRVFVPATRERVRIKGRSDEYLVLAVNREDQVAYIVEVQRDSGYVETVRFDRLERVQAERAPLQPNAAD